MHPHDYDKGGGTPDPALPWSVDEESDRELWVPAHSFDGLTDEQIARLGGIDAVEHLTEAAETLSTVDACDSVATVGLRVMHNKPVADYKADPEERHKIADAAVLIENAMRLMADGFQEGVLYATSDGKRMVTVERTASGTYSLQDTLPNPHASCCLVTYSKSGEVRHKAWSPTELKAMRKRLLPWLPVLDRVNNAPTWKSRDDGTLYARTEAGFDPVTRTFRATAYTLPTHVPSKAEAEAALSVLTKPLADFDFATSDGLPNAVGLLLTSALRDAFAHVPGFIISAPSAGVGKTFLAQTFARMLTGGELPSIHFEGTEPGSASFGAALLNATSTLVLLDEPENRTEPIGTAWLNDFLTGTFNKRLRYRRDATLMGDGHVLCFAGIGLTTKREFTRRTVRIDLGNGRTYPKGAEEALERFAVETHDAFYPAVATLVNYWTAKGSPDGPLELKSFAAWARVISGIMETVGMTGLREKNLERDTATSQRARGDFFGWLHDQSPVAGQNGKEHRWTFEELWDVLAANSITAHDFLEEVKAAPENSKEVEKIELLQKALDSPDTVLRTTATRRVSAVMRLLEGHGTNVRLSDEADFALKVYTHGSVGRARAGITRHYAV